MAVGTVSGVSDDVWQLIATNTPSAVTSSTFSSIPGYRKLMLTYQIPTLSTSSGLGLQFNGDSTAGNYGSTAGLYTTAGGARSNTRICATSFSEASAYGFIVIADADKTTPKWVENIGGQQVGYGSGVYFGTSAISSILVLTDSTQTMTGTIKLYGIAA
tara:strand:+ start:20 stop:496 length:477 start_codon:yes stop_codon:yes gene_type:complete